MNGVPIQQAVEKVSRKNRRKGRPRITSSDLFEMDNVAHEWGLTVDEFQKVSPDGRARMAAFVIMDGWIEMVMGDV